MSRKMSSSYRTEFKGQLGRGWAGGGGGGRVGSGMCGNEQEPHMHQR